MDRVRALDKDLWVIDHPFRMPGGIELGARTTLVRLSDGGLLRRTEVAEAASRV